VKALLLCLLLLIVGDRKLSGTVYVVGNEPFTSVAVECSNGKMYRIKTTKELEKRLRTLQGKKVELQYTKLVRAGDTQTITVSVVTELQQ
jgi:hypothetical protein